MQSSIRRLTYSCGLRLGFSQPSLPQIAVRFASKRPAGWENRVLALGRPREAAQPIEPASSQPVAARSRPAFKFTNHTHCSIVSASQAAASSLFEVGGRAARSRDLNRTPYSTKKGQGRPPCRRSGRPFRQVGARGRETDNTRSSPQSNRSPALFSRCRWRPFTPF